MKIYIFDEEIDKNDGKIIQLLDSSSIFQKRIEEIRDSFGIPKSGFDCETASLEGKYLLDSPGNKLKLAKPFPRERTKDAYNYMAAFLNDPDIAISGKGEFGREIEKTRKAFNLDKRWYHPICHMVLFSIPGWLNSPITSFIDKPGVKSLWKRPGVIIRISDNISKKQLVKWLDDNWNELRKRLQKELAIKKTKKLPRDKSLWLTKEIIKLREKGETFEAISKKLSDKEYSPSYETTNIQKRYDRYKKLFELKKSHKK